MARWVVDKPTETNSFCVTGGSDGVRLTHNLSKYHAIFAITSSTPQDVKCSQQSNSFSATARNPQHLPTSHSQYVKTNQLKIKNCLQSASDLNNLIFICSIPL
jgi:hypothetical protein